MTVSMAGCRGVKNGPHNGQRGRLEWSEHRLAYRSARTVDVEIGLSGITVSTAGGMDYPA